jgi:hypothetical protein
MSSVNDAAEVYRSRDLELLHAVDSEVRMTDEQRRYEATVLFYTGYDADRIRQANMSNRQGFRQRSPA